MTKLQRLEALEKGDINALFDEKDIMLIWLNVDGSFEKSSYQDRNLTEDETKNIKPSIRITIEQIEEGL